MENTEIKTEKAVLTREDGSTTVFITTTVKTVFNGDENEAVEHHNSVLAGHISSESPACGGAGVGKFIVVPAVLPEDHAVIHSTEIDFGTRKVAGKNARVIFANGHWLAFNEVAWVSAGLAFRGRKGTWVLAHPETIKWATRYLINTGVCPELKKRKGTWVPASTA